MVQNSSIVTIVTVQEIQITSFWSSAPFTFYVNNSEEKKFIEIILQVYGMFSEFHTLRYQKVKVSIHI